MASISSRRRWRSAESVVRSTIASKLGSPGTHTQLTALLAQLDTLAGNTWRAGDEYQERYYGVMFGLETARDELAAIVANMMKAATVALPPGKL
jgi:hypothetical protein